MKMILILTASGMRMILILTAPPRAVALKRAAASGRPQAVALKRAAASGRPQASLYMGELAAVF